MKSLAVVFPAPRQVDLVELDVPPPADGEFTIQTLVTLMSMGTELTCYRADSEPGSHWHRWIQHPFYPGYSCVGRIVRVGAHVAGFHEGDRVFCTMSHRQFANIPADQPNLIAVPKDLSDEEAAWCKLATITQTGVRHMEHVMGDTAVVIGVGPIGQLVVQYLRVMGLSEILVVDPNRARIDRALAHGATAGFPGVAAGAMDFCLEHTEGNLVDVVYDATGNYEVFPDALRMARPFGKVILQGDSPHPSKQRLTYDVLTRQLVVTGTWNERLPRKYAHWTARRQGALFYQYLQRGQMRVSDLITHRLEPADAVEMYPQLNEDRGDSAGVIFDWR
jgi:2-desacetyl-2-hydroxyethyl bacteriochlorophyllide A dehydrogenase